MAARFRGQLRNVKSPMDQHIIPDSRLRKNRGIGRPAPDAAQLISVKTGIHKTKFLQKAQAG
jgi:hypothetical protein